MQISDLEYWKERCRLAEDFINKHPADYDITGEQTEAYYKWKNFVRWEEAKTLTELYSILHASMRDRASVNEDICNNINRLYHSGVFNPREYDILKEHFLSQRPTPELHPEDFDPNQTLSFWWPRNAIGRHKRKIFITKLIHLTKNIEITKEHLIEISKSSYFTTDPQHRGASLCYELGNGIKVHQVDEDKSDCFVEVNEKFTPVKTVYNLQLIIRNHLRDEKK